jgi:hypothetical protein
VTSYSFKMNEAMVAQIFDFLSGSSTERPQIPLPPLKNFTKSITEALFPPLELSSTSILLNLAMTFIMALLIFVAYTGLSKYFSKFWNWLCNKPTTVESGITHPVRRPSVVKRSKSSFEAKVNALVESRIEGVIEDWSKLSHEIQSGTELKISSVKEGFRGDIEEIISQVNEALEENLSQCLARRHEMVVEYAERFKTVNDRFTTVVENGLSNSRRIEELLLSVSEFRSEVDVLKSILSSVQESLKLLSVTPENGRVHHSPISLPQTPNTPLQVPNGANTNAQKDPPVTGAGSSCYDRTVLVDPPVIGVGSFCYENRIPEPQIVHSTPNNHVCQQVDFIPLTHITPFFRHTSLPSTTIIFQSGGSVPMPKFNPKLETAEHFLSELEVYMRRKRSPPEDWTLMLSPIFNQDPDQSLWGKRARMVAKSWETFKQHFRAFYGSDSDKCSALEKLLLRRQRDNESFQTFAFEMDLMYRKVHNLSSDLNVKEVLSFISERALPTLKPHLLAYQAKDLYELVLYGSKIEIPQSANSDAKKTISGSKWVHKESQNNRETSPKPVVSEPKALEKPSNMTFKKVEGNEEFPKPKLKCTFCAKFGHSAENCRSRVQVKKASPLNKELKPSVDPPKPAEKQGNGEGV